jgi:glycosyltransferase involved in cell wall biosynthesis
LIIGNFVFRWIKTINQILDGGGKNFFLLAKKGELGRLVCCLVNKENQMSIPTVSVVVPVFNESESLQELFRQIDQTMIKSRLVPYETIFVDDGSTDDSWHQLKYLQENHPDELRIVRLRKNYGKSTALAVGLKRARAGIIITMDADLQDDPMEIPKFVAKIEQGYDCVSGWKKNRQDPLNRLMMSAVFNRITSLITGIKLKDFNCGFKGYRRYVFEVVDLYGELHRFIPVLLDGFGFKVTEIPITHHPRLFGRSRYGMERIPKGFLDLLTVLMISRFSNKPAHLIGLVGIFFGIFGVSALTYLIIIWFLGYGPIGSRPLLLFGVMATLLSVQLLTTGLLADLLVNRIKIDIGEKIIAEDIKGN